MGRVGERVSGVLQVRLRVESRREADISFILGKTREATTGQNRVVLDGLNTRVVRFVSDDVPYPPPGGPPRSSSHSWSDPEDSSETSPAFPTPCLYKASSSGTVESSSYKELAPWLEDSPHEGSPRAAVRRGSVEPAMRATPHSARSARRRRAGRSSGAAVVAKFLSVGEWCSVMVSANAANEPRRCATTGNRFTS